MWKVASARAQPGSAGGHGGGRIWLGRGQVGSEAAGFGRRKGTSGAGLMGWEREWAGGGWAGARATSGGGEGGAGRLGWAGGLELGRGGEKKGFPFYFQSHFS